MTTVTRWFTAVVTAAVLGVGGGAAWAAENAIILQNNQKVIIDDNHHLFLLNKNGKRTQVKNGTYQTKDGGSIIVQNGVVVQGGLVTGGDRGGIILQNPGQAAGQKVAPPATK